MKKTLFLLAFAAMFTSQSNGQSVKVVSTEHKMSTGSRPALSVHINGVDEKEAMKDFVSFWKDQGAKTDVDDGEMKAVNYEVKDLKPTVFNLFGVVEQDGKDESTAYLWVANGSEFISTSDPAYKHFEQAMKDFGIIENKKPFEKQLKDVEKALGNVTDEKKSLDHDRVNWQKDIDDCNETIQKKQTQLKDSEAVVNDLNVKIKLQEQEAEKVKHSIDGIK